jgi:glycosyltransferase involved in cell wall biosynthesis
MCKIKVGVFSSYYPKYRNAIFARLSHNNNLAFDFLAGMPPNGSNIIDDLVRPYPFHHIRWIAIPILGTHNYISYRFGVVSSLLRRKYDILILSNDILAPDIWVCCLLSRLFRLPVIIWGQGLSRPPSKLRDNLRYALTSLATASLYYTEGGREYWVNYGVPKKKQFVAFNALDTEKQIQIRNKTVPKDLHDHLLAEGLAGKKIVTFIGRLIEEKKPLIFIDAVAKAAANNTDIVGLLIGEGPELKVLERYVKDNALTDNIRFVGGVYDELTIAMFLMSSVTVLLPAFAGLAIQHAAVYGVPSILGAVAHSHGPEQEIVVEGKTGLWCPDGDVDAFAAAILRLVYDPEYRAILSANVQREIDEKYNVARMAQGFIDAVQYCMNSRNI